MANQASSATNSSGSIKQASGTNWVVYAGLAAAVIVAWLFLSKK
jgi:hypothetical protein